MSSSTQTIAPSTPPLPVDDRFVPVAATPKPTYGQILKSSTLVGGSSAVNVAVGIVRTKAMAMLLGPAGFGLFGLYGSIVNLAQNIAGIGINSSGVRQIAEAVQSGDKSQIALTTAVLRRTSLVLGVVGAGCLAIFSRQVSDFTFGSSAHSRAIALLSLAVLFQLVAGAQGALIQGMRQIGDLAKMNTLGAFYGTCISIGVVYLFRENGVVPSLVCVGAATILMSHWYSRRLAVQSARLSAFQVGQEIARLLKLGFAFMSSSLMMMGVAYVVRVIILRKIGYEGTGLYQSAWTMGGLYVGFVLQAMAADFYPRLTASANDNVACNRLVNEQAFVGLLLAGPGAIATLSLAPLIISLLYSAKFAASVGILRWVCLGATLQVVTWPMGFIIVAKARAALLVGCELTWAIVSIGLAWICVVRFGLNGAGIAFFGSYIFHVLLLYPIVVHISGFRWSRENKTIGILYAILIAGAFVISAVLPLMTTALIGIVLASLTAIYSVRALLKVMPIDQIPARLRRVVMRLKFLRQYAAGATP